MLNTKKDEERGRAVSMRKKKKKEKKEKKGVGQRREIKEKER